MTVALDVGEVTAGPDGGVPVALAVFVKLWVTGGTLSLQKYDVLAPAANVEVGTGPPHCGRVASFVVRFVSVTPPVLVIANWNTTLVPDGTVTLEEKGPPPGDVQSFPLTRAHTVFVSLMLAVGGGGGLMPIVALQLPDLEYEPSL